jgi:CrcB protein
MHSSRGPRGLFIEHSSMLINLKDIFWISLGAVAGANMRYAVSRLAAQQISSSLPYGTLLVNVTGSFIIGLFLIWTSERVLADSHWRFFVAIGFCGSYTTFSSYTFETLQLFEQGHYSLACANFFANNLACLIAVLAGAIVARAL